MSIDLNKLQITNILSNLLCEDIALNIVENYLTCHKCKCLLYDKHITNHGCKSCQDYLWSYWDDKYLGWC